MRHESGHTGDFNELGGLSALVSKRAFTELCDGECCALGVYTNTFSSSHLHRLNLNKFLPLEVTACSRSDTADQNNSHTESCNGAPHACGFFCSLFSAEALCAGHPPQRKACNESAGNKPSGGDDVRVFPHEDRVGDDLEEACGSIQFCASGLGVETCAHGVLHPRVCPEDPQGRDHGSDRSQPNAGKVPALGKASPSEDPQTQEG